MTYFQRNKWGRAKKTVVNGVKYDSKFEASEGKDLGTLLKAGKIKDFKAHVRMPLEVNGFHIADYYIDFMVEHLDGTIEFIETKGIKTPDWVLKWKIFETMYGHDPKYKLTLVQQKRFRMRRIRRV